MKWQRRLLFSSLLIVFLLFGIISCKAKIVKPDLLESKPIVESLKLELVDESLYSEKWSKLLDDIQKIFTIAAFSIGGIWTYFNYFKGRIYKQRLELDILASIIEQNGVKYLIAKISLLNLGLTQTQIKKEGTALVISSYKSPHTSTENNIFELVIWEDVAAYDVFTNHDWIEPNEKLEEEYLILVHQENPMPIKLRLRVTSPTKIEWNEIKILTSQQ
ncbi:hypothetical protein [Nostoc sp.]|uniref:hypothetical protein n=1 Tax=Nostoc sp. TaxID=1180 RepID=UPI0035941D75